MTKTRSMDPSRVADVPNKTCPACLLTLASVSALGAGACDCSFFRKVIGEGALVVSIGKSDHEAFHRDVAEMPGALGQGPKGDRCIGDVAPERSAALATLADLSARSFYTPAIDSTYALIEIAAAHRFAAAARQ